MRWLPIIGLGALAASCRFFVVATQDEVAIPMPPPTTLCRTTCGMLIDNLPEGECNDLSQREAEIVESYSAITHVHNVCDALQGWRLALVDADNGLWKVGPQWVYGATVCDSKLTFVGLDPSRSMSALPHEVGHIIDCRRAGPRPVAMHQHDGWRARGFCEAISRSSPLDIPCELDALAHGLSRTAH
jgi:hypothetical protein